eukprot:g567.t1
MQIVNTETESGARKSLSPLLCAVFDSLATNKYLKVLNLYNCAMGDHGLKALVESLKGNVTLTFLDLTHNDLGALSGRYVKKLLRQENSGICKLILSTNFLGVEGAKRIAAGMRDNPSLEVLNLSHNAIECAGTIYILNALETAPRLRELNLEANAISSGGAAEIGMILSKNRTLKTLVLSNNNLRDVGILCMKEGLRSGLNCSLQILHLSNCGIGATGATAIADALIKRTCVEEKKESQSMFGICNLSELSLSCNKRLGPKGATEIARVLQNSSKLKSLDLGNCNIGSEGIFAIAKVLGKASLKPMPLLHTVDEKDTAERKKSFLLSPTFSNKPLHPHNLPPPPPPSPPNVMKKMTEDESDDKRSCCSLETLFLYGNRLNMAKGSECARLLGRSPTLKTLSLADNRIDDDGASALAALVRCSRSLTQLDLEGNRIACRGATALIRGISASFVEDNEAMISNEKRETCLNKRGGQLGIRLGSNLSILNLADNNIGKVGASKIAEAIGEIYAKTGVPSHLADLDVSGNNIGEQGMREIEAAVRKNNVAEIHQYLAAKDDLDASSDSNGFQNEMQEYVNKVAQEEETFSNLSQNDFNEKVTEEYRCAALQCAQRLQKIDIEHNINSVEEARNIIHDLQNLLKEAELSGRKK